MKLKNDDTIRIEIAIYGGTIRTIRDVVRKRYKISLREINEHRRTKRLTKARHLIYFFCRNMVSHCNLDVIGYVIANGNAWDHATICYGAKKIEKEFTLKHRDGRLVYPELHQEILELGQQIISKIKVDNNADIMKCPCCGKILLD